MPFAARIYCDEQYFYWAVRFAFIWKQARKLVINSELKSAGLLPLSADEDAPMVYVLIGS